MRATRLPPNSGPDEGTSCASSLSARARSWVRRRTLVPLAVGAVTLLFTHVLFKPHARPWEVLARVPLAHAERETSPLPAPADLALAAVTPVTNPKRKSAQMRTSVTDYARATIGDRMVPAATNWHGVAGLAVHRRDAPNRARPSVGLLQAGEPVRVVRWVSGEAVEPHNDTWAELADGTFVYATTLRRAGDMTSPAPPAAAPTVGRWIDVNLTEQIATAYDGQTVVRTALISSGRPGWETPQGTLRVLRRVECDTMDSAMLIGRVTTGVVTRCKVEHVRYVQYFTDDGAAIHENYWRRPATFGIPGSHGCIGMAPADAAWFWEFTTVGTPLLVHE
jgi:hypothetical protein